MNIPIVKVPKFSMTLPVSKAVIEFRPFLVKEEKILLLAKESENAEDSVRGIVDVVQACTFDEMTPQQYCLADMQYAFLQIRGKSIGEDIELLLICGNCDAKHPYTMSVKDFDIENADEMNKVITLDGVKVEMKYPDIFHYGRLMEDDSNETIYQVLVECIEKIYTEDEMFMNSPERYPEVRDFIDNLTTENFQKFEKFFLKMPMLMKKIDFTCRGCQTNNTLRVDSIRNFFQ